MEMYDWIVLAIVTALAVRGWMRGAVRETLDVALLLFGSLLVFRLSPAVGTVLAGMANIPYEVARVVASVLLFGILIV
ncbi:MAG: CvpA family protein, partial [Acidimicrobiia bacterium]